MKKSIVTSKKRLIVVILGVVALLHSIVSCTKLVEVDAPTTSSNALNVYDDDVTAAAVLTGIYTDLSGSGFGPDPATSLALGLSADELTVFNLNDPGLIAYYNNSLLPVNQTWSRFYNIIFVANSAIEGMSSSTALTTSVKRQLMGEAMFIRAFCYFYLVNLYGDVPLAVSTDYKVNAVLPRTSKELVYNQIILDLKEAEELLSTEYLEANILTPTRERVRPTKWAAKAMLARVYLYVKDYVNAESKAMEVMNNNTLYNVESVPLNDVFLKNSNEAIWQLQPVGIGYEANTREGQFFVPMDGQPSSVLVYLSTHLLNSFELGDQRKISWVNGMTVDNVTYNYAYKYKIGREDRSEPSEYLMVLRLAEQYLIRAEARARQGNETGAAADLNVIRLRAGLESTTATSQTALLAAIEHERLVELFTEWGHRWLDIKRTDRADAILNPVKGNYWQSTDQLYPIPQQDILRNPSLAGHQNPGYP